MPDETHSLQHSIALSYPCSKDLGSRDMSHHHYIEKDQSKREKEREREVSWSWTYSIKVWHCQCTIQGTVRHVCLPVQWKLGGVNSNPPAVTGMSPFDKMTPAVQNCHNIWTITETDLISQKHKPADTNLPVFIYINTVMHTLVLVVNSPCH